MRKGLQRDCASFFTSSIGISIVIYDRYDNVSYILNRLINYGLYTHIIFSVCLEMGLVLCSKLFVYAMRPVEWLLQNF